MVALSSPASALVADTVVPLARSVIDTPQASIPFGVLAGRMIGRDDRVALIAVDVGLVSVAGDTQWVVFRADEPTPPAVDLPIRGSGSGTPAALGDDWIAAPGTDADQRPKLWILSVDREGDLSPLVGFEAGRADDLFGEAIATFDDHVFASAPGDPTGVAPIRRYARSTDGRWSEGAPIVVADPGPFFGSAMAVAPLASAGAAGFRLAVSDATYDDPTLVQGRVRLLDMTADGTVLRETVLRRSVPEGELPSEGVFGRRLFLDDDQLVAARVSNTGAIQAVFVYRLRKDGSWAEEAAIEIPPIKSVFPTLDLAVTGRQIALGGPTGTISIHARSATGAWIETASFSSGVPGWTFGATVAWLGPHRLTTLARFGWLDGEAWLLDPFTDCNGNGIDDSEEISSGAVLDVDANGVPDSCDRAADLDRDGAVTATDLALLLGRYGAGPGLGDLDADGEVDASDLAALLGDWGR
jgi:hypothetical protein